jgi:ATP-dependent DNA helicase DinG
MDLATRSTDALVEVTAALPGGEERNGQIEMAAEVARAIETGRHLVVQAGTGTGKTLAYLIPAVLSGKTTVVATATKALQDQLAGKDLPFLAAQLDEQGHPFSFAVLKGRSNYVCLQRIDEVEGIDEQLDLDGLADRAPKRELELVLEWAAETSSGDRAELSFEPSPATWAALSVSSRECPGATRCPRGEECFTEQARNRASAADVIVVNTHLYGLHLASEGALLPEHDVVVIDEAHQLEEVISATSGLEVTPGRLVALANLTKAILADQDTITDLHAAADRVAEALAAESGRRLRAIDGELGDAFASARLHASRVLDACRRIPDDGPRDVKARKQRAVKAATSLIDDLDALSEIASIDVAWVEGPADRPVLRIAPIEVGDILEPALWTKPTAVLTSATIPLRLPERLGLRDRFTESDVGSPFDYERQALLYCAAHLPDPRQPDFEEEMHRELALLITAAGGRTLALFTSWRAMDAAAEALDRELPGALLTQRDLPKPALLEAFTQDEESSLFATMGFWQGVDIPGPALSLLTIDRLPFPRPDEPLLQARRERARETAFATIDLPRAAMLLAQGSGRLIRSRSDAGVVAVLDSRLATARYRWDLVRALPPMNRTKDPDEAVAFLEGIATARDAAEAAASATG